MTPGPTPHPAPLAAHYTRFRVAERLLLTGHSHQAWPDVAFAAQQEAWLEAARWVDDKWEAAFRTADRVRAGVGELLDDPGAEVALGQNTFELVARFLSALPLRSRPRLVTTDGEFHTLRRLLDRLAEEGVEVVRVPVDPRGDVGEGPRGAEVLRGEGGPGVGGRGPGAPGWPPGLQDLPERLAAEVDGRTAAVLVSSVLYQSALRVPGLGRVQEACLREGAELLVDAYHSVNVVSLSLREEGLRDAWVVGGGYKYLQWGEGCCFLRLPPETRLRPVLTGWFAEFAELGDPPTPGGVAYGEGAHRFAGSTYDPTAHYRAAAVLDLFRELGLTVPVLRETNQRQVARLLRRFRDADPDPRHLALGEEVPLEARGGFVTFRTPRARSLVGLLRTRGVWVDARGDRLRMGPAPYLSDAQLDEAMDRVVEAAEEVRGLRPAGP